MRKNEYPDWRNKDQIEDNVQDKPQLYEAKILKYIKAGNELGRAYTIYTDVFSPGKNINAASYTDGELEWDDPLIYYVENYHYRVSDEFVAHMKKNNWECPKMTEKETSEYWDKRDKFYDDERAIELLESGLWSVNEGFSFKAYNVNHMDHMIYQTNTKYNRNWECVIDGILLDPFGKDIPLHEFCYAYYEINRWICKADVYAASNDEKKIKYAMSKIYDDSYIFWKIVD